MTTKIAVSLPDHLVEAARTAVRQGRAPSVSAFVAEAMTHRLRAESVARLLADLDDELGPPPPEDRAWADRVLGLP